MLHSDRESLELESSVHELQGSFQVQEDEANLKSLLSPESVATTILSSFLIEGIPSTSTVVKTTR